MIHSASCGDHLTTVLEYPLLRHRLILGPLGTGSRREEYPEKGMMELRTSEILVFYETLILAIKPDREIRKELN